MGKIKLTTNCNGIEGLCIIEPQVYEDARGYFMETYNYNDFKSVSNCNFVQDNQSMSVKGVLRGMHFQKKYPQGKLVRAISGRIFDAVIDIRKGSKTYGKWFGTELSAENKKQLYVPAGMAHGFLVLSDTAEFCYKCTEFYHPEDECGIAYNDGDIGIEWPIEENMQIILSDKDKKWKSFKETMEVQNL